MEKSNGVEEKGYTVEYCAFFVSFSYKGAPGVHLHVTLSRYGKMLKVLLKCQ